MASQFQPQPLDQNLQNSNEVAKLEIPTEDKGDNELFQQLLQEVRSNNDELSSKGEKTSTSAQTPITAITPQTQAAIGNASAAPTGNQVASGGASLPSVSYQDSGSSIPTGSIFSQTGGGGGSGVLVSGQPLTGGNNAFFDSIGKNNRNGFLNEAVHRVRRRTGKREIVSRTEQLGQLEYHSQDDAQADLEYLSRQHSQAPTNSPTQIKANPELPISLSVFERLAR